MSQMPSLVKRRATRDYKSVSTGRLDTCSERCSSIPLLLETIYSCGQLQVSNGTIGTTLVQDLVEVSLRKGSYILAGQINRDKLRFQNGSDTDTVHIFVELGKARRADETELGMPKVLSNMISIVGLLRQKCSIRLLIGDSVLNRYVLMVGCHVQLRT